jgi:hypothetical protein
VAIQDFFVWINISETPEEIGLETFFGIWFAIRNQFVVWDLDFFRID